MKKISLLGSTGSIGRQTIEVAIANPDKLQIVALCAHTNDVLLEEQIALLHPPLAVLSDEKAASRLKSRYSGPTKILAGTEGLMEAATYIEADTVVGALVGYAGLKPTLAAIEKGKNIALANKETLVAAGHIVMAKVNEYKVHLTPIDSEHSAIFQSLRGGAKKEVKNLILTASGGPFLGKTKEELQKVTLEQCLKHPNWSMGKKVTVDSATLANKGLEVMEAHWLFDVPYENIKVVVHPQSIVHSLVEFQDGSVMGQLGLADMRLPIQYALSYPERFANTFGALDLAKIGSLTFYEPDLENFPALALARHCGKEGGILPCIFNAANEVAVAKFLNGKISYLDIYRLTEKAVLGTKNVPEPTLEEIEFWDKETRQRIE